MKKTKSAAGLLFLFFTAALYGQHIKAGPLEGAWTLESTGTGDIDEAEYKELIFFGNVMLFPDRDVIFYSGSFFTSAGGTIQIDNGEIEWQYALMNDTLTIVDDYEDRYVFKKNQTKIKNPLDGLWRQSGGAGYDENREAFFLFTRDILAGHEDDSFFGYRIEFKGSRIYPNTAVIEGKTGRKTSQDELEMFALEYSLRGKTLSLSMEGETMVLTKIY
jgi:hypothetical protein